MRNSLLIVSSLLMGLVMACGQDAKESQLHLINGKTTREYNASVVMLFPHNFCTGTKVSPRLILTAAHCLRGNNEGDSVQVTNFPERKTADTSQWFSGKIKRVIMNDAWNRFCGLSSTDRCYDSPNANLAVPIPDVALLEFTTALPTQWTTAKIDLKPIETGESLTIVGYGCKTWVHPAGKPAVVTKRFFHTVAIPAVTNINKISPLYDLHQIDRFDDRFVLTPGVENSNQTSTTNASLCPGDSGGPLIRRSSNAIVGVNSFSDQLSSNIHTRLSHASDDGIETAAWLQRYLPAASFIAN